MSEGSGRRQGTAHGGRGRLVAIVKFRAVNDVSTSRPIYRPTLDSQTNPWASPAQPDWSDDQDHRTG